MASGAGGPAGGLTRRGFLGTVGAGTALAASGAAAGTPPRWDALADVVVVGSGAAALSAALTARELGNRVVVLEKSSVRGGTTAKSVGGIWAPNHHLLRAAGVHDDRREALRYMVRLSFPQAYDPAHPRFGASEDGFALIAAFYDHVAPAVEWLVARGALRVTNEVPPAGVLMPDYFAHLPEDRVPEGRILFPLTGDGAFGNGATLAAGLASACGKRGAHIELGQRVTAVVRDGSGRVVGVAVVTAQGRERRVGARKGVVFATGGFTHDPALCREFLKGPIFGGCAMPSSEGDFVRIGAAAGAALGNMANAWWAQIPLEEALAVRSVATGIWCSPGDSMIQVNRFGRRFFDEKFVYNERTQAHFVWDPMSASYPNLVSVLLYDARTAHEFAGFPPVPPAGAELPFVLRADDLEGLTRALRERLARLAPHTGGLRLDDAFLPNLRESIARFNRFAEAGEDAEFGRGSVPIDRFFHFFGPRQPANPMPNPTMHPIAGRGPYYAVLMAPGTLDTKGGPRIDPQARVLDAEGRPIPGLYGAGNCIAAPAGPAYWAGGATLGPALTFGHVAGRSVHRAPVADPAAG